MIRLLYLSTPLPPPFIQQRRLLGTIYALDGPERGGIPRKSHAFVALEAADEVPFDGSGEETGFLLKFLEVVFAEVGLVSGWVGVEGEDVAGGFEFGDGDEAGRGGFWRRGGCGVDAGCYGCEVGEKGGGAGGGGGSNWGGHDACCLSPLGGVCICGLWGWIEGYREREYFS